ncbi:uncharacterized protein RAG0_14899 [Rhynchosporium agropyri]|uniref:Uncharacterized protein n=1 Tax=Rhynchosporium agropyri TaxID=914238 RepID=A0A1E1LIU2_9HELO|nr:uncharacterized protein RAG0_14899 [Rhynchosporium agropyri]
MELPLLGPRRKDTAPALRAGIVVVVGLESTSYTELCLQSAPASVSPAPFPVLPPLLNSVIDNTTISPSHPHFPETWLPSRHQAQRSSAATLQNPIFLPSICNLNFRKIPTFLTLRYASLTSKVNIATLNVRRYAISAEREIVNRNHASLQQEPTSSNNHYHQNIILLVPAPKSHTLSSAPAKILTLLIPSSFSLPSRSTHHHHLPHIHILNLRNQRRRITNVLHRSGEDASIVAARERVLLAERREKEADQALAIARTAVRDARESVKLLEKEAKEEARLAKIKQSQASSLSKREHGLGRHGHA